MDNNPREIGAHESRTHLGRLLDRVEGGESLVITRHGVPVARLVPYAPYAVDVDRERARGAIAGLLASRNGCRLAGLSIGDLIDEGRS